MFLEKKPIVLPTGGGTGNDADSKLSTGNQKECDALPTQDSAADDVDSEVSDVEERGYCDVLASDPELQMELKPVRKYKIEALYSNTDIVSMLLNIANIDV